MPVVPTALGYDARVQLLHEDDALAVLTRATTGDFVGTVNVGGEGTLLLSQAIRRLGRVEVPLPTPTLGSVGRLLAPVRLRRLLARADALPELRPRRRHDGPAHGVRLHAPLHDRGRARATTPARVDARRSRRGWSSRSTVAASARCSRRVGDTATAVGDRLQPGAPGARPAGGARCLRPASSRCGPTTTSRYVPPPTPARLGGAARRRAGVPAPPADRRVRDRRVRLRPRPDRPRAAAAAAAAVRPVVPGREPGHGERARRTAARSSSPTTPARCRSTR